MLIAESIMLIINTYFKTVRRIASLLAGKYTFDFAKEYLSRTDSLDSRKKY